MPEFDKETAEWLEIVIRQLAELKPVSIALVAVNPDASTYAAELNCDSTALAIIENAIAGERISELFEEAQQGDEDDESSE